MCKWEYFVIDTNEWYSVSKTLNRSRINVGQEATNYFCKSNFYIKLDPPKIAYNIF